MNYVLWFVKQKCGNVLSWKRVQGASGKLQGLCWCLSSFFRVTERTKFCIPSLCKLIPFDVKYFAW